MLKILFVASECVPFVKTGGLADVVGALPQVLSKQGCDVRVILPKYSSISDEYINNMTHVVDFELELGWRRQYCGIDKYVLDGITYYFVDNRYYFGRNYIYGFGGDEFERFSFFNRAVLNALPLINFIPDVIHANDWQAGMVPALLKIQYAHLPDYSNIKAVFTIHNLQYQGIFNIRDVQDVLGLGDDLFTNDKLEYYGCANFLKAGIVYSDKITTVSPSYAEEIQTAYFGERLDGLLRAKREHLHGIINGIDMQLYNPAIDNKIAHTFSSNDLKGKAACKQALQEELSLEKRPDVPIIAMVGRLSNQKGLDLVDYVISDIMKHDVQFVCLGLGDAKYTNLFSWAEQNYRGRVAARFVMDPGIAHRIYAGADIFLMPSQFEPCGLSQMIAMRYGTVPIVRETGGLRDTVLSYNEYSGEGNGFTFFNYNTHDMLHVIERALFYYQNNREIWNLLIRRGMEGDYSWDSSASKYVALYKLLLGLTDSNKTSPLKKLSSKKKDLSLQAEDTVKKDNKETKKIERKQQKEDTTRAKKKDPAKGDLEEKTSTIKKSASLDKEENKGKKPARKSSSESKS